MNLPAFLSTMRWLIWDTFRQSLASGIFWFMAIVSGSCILFCLSVRVVGDAPLKYPGDLPEFLPRQHQEDPARVAAEKLDVVQGELSLLFGALRVQLGRNRLEAIRFIQLLLAGVVADAAGLLLALIWTAGFLPSFLEPHAVSVLLAKPVPRWNLLLGKYVGVLAFVLAQAIFFVGGTWLALGISTGVWDPLYLISIPMLLLHFAIFFSFSTLLAVCSRSTVVCVIGSLVFWFLCWGMNYGRHALIALDSAPSAAAPGAAEPDHALSPAGRWAVEAGYWIMPKPADLGILLFDALQAQNYFGRMLEFKAVEARGAFHPELSIFASLLSTLAILAVAARQFVTMDY